MFSLRIQTRLTLVTRVFALVRAGLRGKKYATVWLHIWAIKKRQPEGCLFCERSNYFEAAAEAAEAAAEASAAAFLAALWAFFTAEAAAEAAADAGAEAAGVEAEAEPEADAEAKAEAANREATRAAMILDMSKFLVGVKLPIQSTESVPLTPRLVAG